MSNISDTPKPWFVYLLRCSDGTLYTGITTNLDRRLWEHNSSTSRGARYTRSRQPVHLIYSESAADRSHASKREYQIRKMRHQRKLRLAECRNHDA